MFHLVGERSEPIGRCELCEQTKGGSEVERLHKKKRSYKKYKLESWLSGRKRLTANEVRANPLHGFESHTLRTKG